jgi:hypothetical protein
MRRSFAVYASVELMKVLPKPEASVLTARPVVRSARARGGVPRTVVECDPRRAPFA